MPSVITYAVLIVIVTVAAYITSTKAAYIKPAEAIRYGAPSKDFRKKALLNVSDLKLFSVEIVLAIKQLLSSKRQSLFMLFAMITTIFVVIFMININNALIHLSDNAAFWGNDNSEILISRLIEKNGLSNEQLVKDLKQDKNIKDIVPWYYLDNNIIKKDAASVSQKITGFIYDGDMNSIGLLNIKGKNPIANNEVSLAINTSRINKKDVGDYIDIFINGKKKTFLVTGVYQTLNNNAEGFRAQMAAVKDLSEDFQLALYCINLKPKVSQEYFMKYIKNRYADKIDVKKTSEVVNNLSGAIGNGMTIPIYFIALTFAVVSFITIFNTILINIYEEKKNYGIFKSLGISSFQIRRAIVYRVMFLLVISLIIGVPLGIMLPPKIVGILLSSSGMLEIPITITKLGTAMALIACAVLVFIASVIPASKIFNINSRQLIEE
jgi:ABC-type transport system, involved in lipoprotein release, permease component